MNLTLLDPPATFMVGEQIWHNTFASALLTAGANPWYVAEQLGHVDVQMVFQAYGKFIPQDYQRPKTTGLKIAG